MKDGVWERARIIDCRLKKEWSEDSKKKKTQYSYQYYVHYLNYNRRMDEWVERERIKLTDEII